MASLRYGLEVVNPVIASHARLKRRASSPELATLSSILESSLEIATPPYQVAKMIRIQLRSHTINARIMQLFTPVTMAPVMIVRLHAPHIDLKGDFVLKVYDRRYASLVRKEEEAARWCATHEVQFQIQRWRDPSLKLACDLISHDSHQTYSADDEAVTEGVVDAQDRECSSESAWQEFEMEYTAIRAYSRELETYRRAREHRIDGKDIPRFISAVRIPQTYQSRYCTAGTDATEGIPGILIQYIPGFPLSDLYNSLSPVPAQSTWKQIIDSGAQAVATMVVNLRVNNADTCPRNTVVHWDPIGLEWKCKMIDFGRCYFQDKATSDYEWRRRQWGLDEEAGIAVYMEDFLKKEKGFEYKYQQSQYYKELTDEFDDDGPSDWDSFHTDDDRSQKDS